jgi:hypothetical protein
VQQRNAPAGRTGCRKAGGQARTTRAEAVNRRGRVDGYSAVRVVSCVHWPCKIRLARRNGNSRRARVPMSGDEHRHCRNPMIVTAWLGLVAARNFLF